MPLSIVITLTCATILVEEQTVSCLYVYKKKYSIISVLEFLVTVNRSVLFQTILS